MLDSLDWNLNITTPGEYARVIIKEFLNADDQEFVLLNLDDYINICLAS